MNRVPPTVQLHGYLVQLRSMRMQHSDGITPDYYKGIADLLLDKGSWFTGPGEALTADELELLEAAADIAGGKFLSKECYFNAQILASLSTGMMKAGTDGTLRYFEGYAMGHSIPVMHGWAVTPTNKVIDLTWRNAPVDGDPVIKHPNAGRWGHAFAVGTMPKFGAYLGVEINVAGCWQRADEREEWNPYLDDWRHEWPLLKREAWK